MEQMDVTTVELIHKSRLLSELELRARKEFALKIPHQIDIAAAISEDQFKVIFSNVDLKTLHSGRPVLDEKRRSVAQLLAVKVAKKESTWQKFCRHLEGRKQVGMSEQDGFKICFLSFERLHQLCTAPPGVVNVHFDNVAIIFDVAPTKDFELNLPQPTLDISSQDQQLASCKSALLSNYVLSDEKCLSLGKMFWDYVVNCSKIGCHDDSVKLLQQVVVDCDVRAQYMTILERSDSSRSMDLCATKTLQRKCLTFDEMEKFESLRQLCNNFQTNENLTHKDLSADLEVLKQLKTKVQTLSKTSDEHNALLAKLNVVQILLEFCAVLQDLYTLGEDIAMIEIDTVISSEMAAELYTQYGVYEKSLEERLEVAVNAIRQRLSSFPKLDAADCQMLVNADSKYYDVFELRIRPMRRVLDALANISSNSSSSKCTSSFEMTSRGDESSEVILSPHEASDGFVPLDSENCARKKRKLCDEDQKERAKIMKWVQDKREKFPPNITKDKVKQTHDDKENIQEVTRNVNEQRPERDINQPYDQNIYVRGFPSTYTDIDVAQLFADFGPVYCINRSKKDAHVVFLCLQSRKMVDEAIREMNQAELTDENKCTFTLSVALSTKPHVPHNFTLRRIVSAASGEKSCVRRRKKRGLLPTPQRPREPTADHHKSFPYSSAPTYTDEETRPDNKAETGLYAVVPSVPTTGSPEYISAVTDPCNKSIYISGFPKFYTELDIGKIFAPYGNVYCVNKAYSKPESTSGYGFVCMETEDICNTAIACLNGLTFRDSYGSGYFVVKVRFSTKEHKPHNYQRHKIIPCSPR